MGLHKTISVDGFPVLMKFFHDCIDFERSIEINKQELVLKEDYSIYNVYKALAGPGKKFLLLRDV